MTRRSRLRRSIPPIAEDRIASLLNPDASIPEAPLQQAGPHLVRCAGSGGDAPGPPSSHLAQVTTPVHTERFLLLGPSRHETSEHASSLNHLARLPAAPAEASIWMSA